MSRKSNLSPNWCWIKSCNEIGSNGAFVIYEFPEHDIGLPCASSATGRCLMGTDDEVDRTVVVDIPTAHA